MDAVQLTHKVVAETLKKNNDTKKSTLNLKPVNLKKVEVKKESKPPKDNAKIQTKESSASQKGLIVSIDTVKKP